ncbi:hypothetical protein ABAZ39_15345 (plasmid) [Azospirillum argentinense]|uniref:Uncharacterized protein n=2 Tax=Azospirillum argentinense TaxID=2970906 RepID=A0A060DQ70_9PROT|nr:hypothetical protein [Azospirillum argentinense]AIB13328.1 hypothetical protein ABAZ39_15345 [Azospirillum argentinense]EZQ06337.1 hypothetical protein ABAZ39_22765 [Azospirillum argentinense]
MSMPEGTLDRETLQAVGVLKRAVDEARVPGVLEFRLLSSALDRTLETEDLHELNEAKRVYETLDGECRTLVVERATSLAHAEAAERRAPHEEVEVDVVPVAAAKPEPPASSPSAPPAGPPPGLRGGRTMRPATGFLAALNGVRSASRSQPPGQRTEDGAPDSRATAKSRLMAAVEERRESDHGARFHSGGPVSDSD